jgi:hypothetical protein
MYEIIMIESTRESGIFNGNFVVSMSNASTFGSARARSSSLFRSFTSFPVTVTSYQYAPRTPTQHNTTQHNTTQHNTRTSEKKTKIIAKYIEDSKTKVETSGYPYQLQHVDNK